MIYDEYKSYENRNSSIAFDICLLFFLLFIPNLSMYCNKIKNSKNNDKCDQNLNNLSFKRTSDINFSGFVNIEFVCVLKNIDNVTI